MDRIFHRRFTVGAKSGIALFSLLALYFFWTKTAVIGLLLLIVVVGMIERVIHTTYTFRRVKPIDRDEEHEFLVIDKGRLSTNVNIPVNEIVKVSTIRTVLGLGHYLLLEYGAGNMTGVEPENEEAFLNELKKRQAIGDMAVKKEDDET